MLSLFLVDKLAPGSSRWESRVLWIAESGLGYLNITDLKSAIFINAAYWQALYAVQVASLLLSVIAKSLFDGIFPQRSRHGLTIYMTCPFLQIFNKPETSARISWTQHTIYTFNYFWTAPLSYASISLSATSPPQSPIPLDHTHLVLWLILLSTAQRTKR